MAPTVFLVLVAVASAVLAMWLCVRLDVAASSWRGAFFCFAAAWLLCGLPGPLTSAALAQMRPGLAILTGVLPVLTATFLCAAACLRYLADRLGHALR